MLHRRNLSSEAEITKKNMRMKLRLQDTMTKDDCYPDTAQEHMKHQLLQPAAFMMLYIKPIICHIVIMITYEWIF